MLSRSMMLLGCAAMAAGNTQSWLYADVLNRGPANWGTESAVCAEGMAQSPIDISSPVVDRYLKPLNMSYNAAKGFKTRNKQYVMQMVASNDVGYVLDANNEDKRYDLAYINFHAPSEHGISGGQYDLEMHLVHTLHDSSDIGETHTKLVVAVFFQASGKTPNTNFEFFDTLPAVPVKDFKYYAYPATTFSDRVNTSSATFDFAGLITSRTYYTYNGSWTTPPCTENVKWFVMSDVGTISQSQLDYFRSAMYFNTELSVATKYGLSMPTYAVFGNNRPMQASNNRTVAMFTDNYPNYGVGGSDETAAFAVSFTGLLLAVMTIAIASFVIYNTMSH